MNFFRRFRFWGSNATGQKKGPQEIAPNITIHEDAPNVTIDAALQVSTVWACASLIVENISSLPLMLYSTDSNGVRSLDKTSRMYAMLHDKPNARQTAIEFWEQMLLNYIFRGNCYARVRRDAQGIAFALLPLSADQMEVIVSDDGSLLYYYSVDNTGIVYAPDDVLHIRGMGNGLVGLSPLDYMRSSVNLAVSAQNHTTKTFKKQARRPGLLMCDSVFNDTQRAAVKKNFGDIATGGGRELYVLEAQFKFEPLGMSPADIQLLETRKFSVQDLARWFGVPSVLINDTQETTSLGSSVNQIVEGFYKLKLRALLERIEQAIHQRVLTPQQRASGMIAEFNMDALLRASLKDRMDIYSKSVQNGLKTRNECRAKENESPLPGGDLLTAQMNLMPVEQLGQQMERRRAVPEQTIEQ